MGKCRRLVIRKGRRERDIHKKKNGKIERGMGRMYEIRDKKGEKGEKKRQPQRKRKKRTRDAKNVAKKDGRNENSEKREGKLGCRSGDERR